MGWREQNAPYGLQQLAAHLGMSWEQLLARPDIVAAAVGTMEGGQRGARHVAESFMDFVEKNGGGAQGILAAIPHYDTMVMANPRQIGDLSQYRNATIAGLNPAHIQPAMAHIQGVQTGQPRLTPEGYDKNFSAPYAGMPTHPGAYQHVRDPAGNTHNVPAWAVNQVATGQFIRTPSGEYLVPSDAQRPFQAAWSRQAAPVEPVVKGGDFRPSQETGVPGFVLTPEEAVRNLPRPQEARAATPPMEAPMGLGGPKPEPEPAPRKIWTEEHPNPLRMLPGDHAPSKTEPRKAAAPEPEIGPWQTLTPTAPPEPPTPEIRALEGMSRQRAPNGADFETTSAIPEARPYSPPPAPPRERAPDTSASWPPDDFWQQQDRNHFAGGGDVEEHAGKVDQATAQYRAQPNEGKRCGDCSMYRPPHCTAVKGTISPNGWCKYWHAEGRESGGVTGHNFAQSTDAPRAQMLQDPPLTIKPELMLPWMDREQLPGMYDPDRSGRRGEPPIGIGVRGVLKFKDGGAIAEDLAQASEQVDRNPTEGQKKAGNYAKGHISFHGLDVAIENPEGGYRSGKDKGGKTWSVRMPAAYGYIKGSEGKDGDHVDVYLGRDHASNKVFVIDQVEAGTRKFDEHKCMLFYPTQGAALADYRRAFSDGKANQRIGAVTQMSVAEFRDWLNSGTTKKPIGRIRTYKPSHSDSGSSNSAVGRPSNLLAGGK